LNIPPCCKDNLHAYIEIKIDSLFSNKIMLCKKHYDLHMEHDNNSVSILGYILKQEFTEVKKSTKQESGNKQHSISVPSLGIPEELLSLQNIEEPMTVSLETDNSNQRRLYY